MEPSSQTSTSTDTTAAPTPVGFERRIFVSFSILLVAVMFVGMVGLLWWHERPAPTALLVLRVAAADDGATATIDSASGRDLSPIITTLKGNQEVRIPLPPGDYIVKIEKGQRRVRAEIALTDYSYFPILLDGHPASQPAKSK
jgi:hypothetical protein